MARKIDVSNPSKLSDDDLRYLEDRGRLPRGIESIRAKEQNNDRPGLPDNTGDVGTADDDAVREAEAARAAAERREAELREELDRLKEQLEGPAELPDAYEDWSKEQLLTEVKSRNEGRPPEERLPTSGNKAQLIELLAADDAREDEED